MRVLLGISGGIAAYKTPDLVRALRRAGHEVRCVLTVAASRLVAADALAAVSGHAVATALWPAAPGSESADGEGSMPHISLARFAERVLIAPATADILARCALGLADDLLTTLVLAIDAEVPLIFAPAMNTAMWTKPVVQAHVATLRSRGARMVDPVPGELACGDVGIGALAGNDALLAALK